MEIKDILYKNLYKTLGVDRFSTEADIKKAYRLLSKKFHPDVNKDIDISHFNEITMAYDVLCSEDREEYDIKSKFGNSYNEYYELLNTNFEMSYESSTEKLKKFKSDELLNIHIEIDDTFNGSIEYERYVMCKSCDGSGKDTSSKIIIKDNNGKILQIFDAEDGCDFCEGSGKDYNNNTCSFCNGGGKVGLTPCNTCKGDKRILGKQKLKNIKLTGLETKIEAMGHYSKIEPGKVGYILITK